MLFSFAYVVWNIICCSQQDVLKTKAASLQLKGEHRPAPGGGGVSAVGPRTRGHAGSALSQTAGTWALGNASTFPQNYSLKIKTKTYFVLGFVTILALSV